MPGINIIYDNTLNYNSVSDSLADLKHEPDYEIKRIFETPNFVSAFSGYQSYPNQQFEDDSAIYFIEGLIYNKADSEIESLLKAISKTYVAGNDYKTLIRMFVDASDGDFFILVYFKRLGELIIFNDRWGRLPAYYYQDSDMFVFSRELKFILNFIPSIEFDKKAVAEFLVFKYVLGDRTLIRNIHRASPSCVLNLIRYGNKFKIKVDKVFDIDFEQSPKKLSKRECLEKCRDLFIKSISDRVRKVQEKKYNITADLSGGYDTRTVFAGLCKQNVDVEYYTDSIDTHESEYVDRIAVLYNKKLIKILTSHDMNSFDMNSSDLSKITYMTDCTTEVQIALPRYKASLERTRLVKDASVKFMGLGGEAMRILYRAPKGYKSIVDMMKDGLLVSGTPIEQACSILGLNVKHFYEHLEQYFNKYPEPTLRDKVKHLYFEYTNHWDNGGENRHRLHFWTVSPLWAKDLFEFELKYMPIEYNGFNINRELILSIDCNALRVPLFIENTNLKSKVSLYKSALLRNLKIRMKNTILRHNKIYKFLIKISHYFKHRKQIISNKRSKQYERLKQALLASFNNLKTLSSLFSDNGIKELLDGYSDTKIYQLLTLILYLGEIERRYDYKIRTESPE